MDETGESHEKEVMPVEFENVCIKLGLPFSETMQQYFLEARPELDKDERQKLLHDFLNATSEAADAMPGVHHDLIQIAADVAIAGFEYKLGLKDDARERLEESESGVLDIMWRQVERGKLDRDIFDEVDQLAQSL